MTVSELIEALKRYPPEDQVGLIDYYNDGEVDLVTGILSGPGWVHLTNESTF